jgi:hypothetical protein
MSRNRLKRLFINLTPFIPLSLTRRGGRDFREGLRPSLTTLPLPLAMEGGQGDRLLNNLRLKGNIVITVIIVI